VSLVGRSSLSGFVMRRSAAAAMLIVAGSLPASAEPRWCAISNEGASNCSFTSMDQCRASISGNGGFCMPEAPVGHRQPRAADIPRNLPKFEADKKLEQQNRKLDRSLKFCRGC
jgi:hypothetical protein